MPNNVKRLLIVLICSMLTITRLSAQIQIGVTGNYSGPVQRYASFADGLWGGGLTVRYSLKPQLVVGLTTRYFTYGESFSTGFAQGNTRSSELRLAGEVDYFLTTSKLRPYAGIEAGLYRSTFRLDTTIPLVESTTYSSNDFGFAPKIGVQYAMSPAIALNAEVGYHLVIFRSTTSRSLLLSAGVFFTIAK